MLTYSKLTDEVMGVILSKLSSRLKVRHQSFSLGFRFWVDIRGICKEVGISHTTYYRWLRVGRSLFGKRGLTDTEKRLRAFARAVEKLMHQKFVSAEDSVPKVDAFGTSLLSKQQSPISDDSHLSQTDDKDVSEIEQLTDELTGGVRCVEYRITNSL